MPVVSQRWIFPARLIWPAKVDKTRSEAGAIDGRARPGPFTLAVVVRVHASLSSRPTSFEASDQAFRIAAQQRISFIDDLVVNSAEHCAILEFGSRN